MSILLNDILNLKDLGNTKIRFVASNRITDPILLFKDNPQQLLSWLLRNKENTKNTTPIKVFKEGQIAIGFVRIEGDKWLLFDIRRITRDLDKRDDGYESERLEEYEKYLGRLIVGYKNEVQQMVKKAESVIDNCSVLQILEDTFDDDIFPGYENVNLSWDDLRRVLPKSAWKTALENQKGVYLITNKDNGKMYVGSAYGTDMIYGRWSSYVETGHGGNVELKNFDFEYIRKNFRYSILDIYKYKTEDKVIINRESWWKNALMTRQFGGYNKN